MSLYHSAQKRKSTGLRQTIARCRYHRGRSRRSTQTTDTVFCGSKRHLKSADTKYCRHYHPRSEQTWCENSLSRCSFSSRLDSTCVRPGAGLVSGNLHKHTLHSYPRRLSISTSLRPADLATRGFAISAFNSSISFWTDFFRPATYPESTQATQKSVPLRTG